MTHTRTSIRRLLNERSARGVRAVKRAILRLHSFQTQDEQAGQKTRWLNQRGFSVATVKRGSALAEKIAAGRYLTPAELEQARELARFHAGQLADFANEREERRAIQAS
jgi:hypothetical protein